MRRLLALLLAGCPVAVAAQEGAAAPPSISLTETAAALARNGVQHQNPRAILAAAEILRLAERGSPRIVRTSPRQGPEGPWEGPMTSGALFRLASRMASDQADWAAAEYAAWLMQLPDSVPPARGAVGGPVWADAYLADEGESSYRIDFEGGASPNLLQVSAGRSRAVLECTLSEGKEAGRPTLSARTLAGTCSIEWRQATRGRVTLRIRNAGPATYYVVTSN
jgi:hypothetical protein